MEIKELHEQIAKVGLDLQAKVKEIGEQKLSSSDFKVFEEKNTAEWNKLKDELATIKTPQLSAAETKAENIEKAHKAYDEFIRKGVYNGAPEVKVLTIGDPATGGYLSTPEYIAEIVKGITEYSPIRSLARVISTSRGSAEIPAEDTLHTAAWTTEAGTKSETTGITWGKHTLFPHECYALVDVSNWNLEDSAFNLESELNEAFVKKFAVLEGTAFVSGNGVGQPEGITVEATVAASYKTTSTASSGTFAAADLFTGFYALKSDYARNATWVMNRAMVGYIRRFTDATTGQFLWQPGMVGNPDMLLGRPIVEATDMASAVAGSAVVAILGDFKRGYVVADRLQMIVQRDPYTQATAGNVRFIARKRVDGKVILPEAFRLVACSA